MKRYLGFLILFLLVAPAPAEVHVFVQNSNALAWVKYECTAGEVVRAFALDVSVDKGLIVGVSDFLRGPSTETARGYGVFPASFRDQIASSPESNINWNVSGYTPVAVMADNPGDTLAGLNSSGVTLEFGALWDPSLPATEPEPAGTLCSLRISSGATVTVKTNLARGGVVAEDPDVILAPMFSGAFVQPPEIIRLSLTNGLLTVNFAGGELEAAPTIAGPWTGAGNLTGQYTEPIESEARKFFRVRGP